MRIGMIEGAYTDCVTRRCLNLLDIFRDVIEATETSASLKLKASGTLLPGLNMDADLSSPPNRVDRANPFAVARALDEQLAETYVNIMDQPNPRHIGNGALVKASLLFQPAHLQVQSYELVTPSSAQQQHLGEHISETGLVDSPEPGDRGVVGHILSAQHPKRHMVMAQRLNPP